MYGEKGHAYVYLIYGMYYCVNFTSGNLPGKPEAVLIRALEPVEGMELMAKRRYQPVGTLKNLTNGPGRLCMAMAITKAENKLDVTAPPFFIKDAEPIAESEVVEATRIGVDYAAEWKDKPWRYYIKKNPYVSKR
jgi:DNA-3-methyladenine glycosylase